VGLGGGEKVFFFRERTFGASLLGRPNKRRWQADVRVGGAKKKSPNPKEKVAAKNKRKLIKKNRAPKKKEFR